MDPNFKQYPGWPKTIHQEDNYARKAEAYLPTLEITGMINPVVQVIDESNNEIVYTLRINGTSYRPKVFKDGVYTINIGEGEEIRILKGIKSLSLEETKTIKVNF